MSDDPVMDELLRKNVEITRLQRELEEAISDRHGVAQDYARDTEEHLSRIDALTRELEEARRLLWKAAAKLSGDDPLVAEIGNHFGMDKCDAQAGEEPNAKP
jgi:hypothetical protein